MSSFTSIGVDDDFAPRETRISVRTTDDELTCGVYQQLRLTIEGALYLFGIACQDTGKEYTADILGDTCLHRSVGYSLRFGRGVRGLDEVIVLGADDDGVDTLRLTFLGVLYRYLALGIGAKVGHEMKLFLANVSQLFEECVGEVERERHQRRSLTAGIAKHNPLVACALLLGSGALDSAVDVGTLTVDGREDTAAVGIEAVGTLVVADLADDVTGYIL